MIQAPLDSLVWLTSIISDRDHYGISLLIIPASGKRWLAVVESWRTIFIFLRATRWAGH